MYESKTMLELWEMKDKANKELEGKSMEEVIRMMEESSLKFKKKVQELEAMEHFQENKKVIKI